MAQSQVNLYNLAISQAGSDYVISATSDQTLAAETCELYYENVRQTVLRAAHWNSAKRYGRLTEETERDADAAWVSTDPEPGYAFSYDLPANYLYARYLSTYERFEIGYETDQKILSCDIGGDNFDDRPILCYTVDVTDVTIWEPDLYRAMYFALAAHICMPLNGKPSRARELFQYANAFLMDAQTQNANEMHRYLQQRVERLAARGYSYTPPDLYVYPFGNLFSGTGASLR